MRKAVSLDMIETIFQNGKCYIPALSRKNNCSTHGHVTPQIKGNFLLITNIGIENIQKLLTYTLI